MPEIVLKSINEEIHDVIDSHYFFISYFLERSHNVVPCLLVLTAQKASEAVLCEKEDLRPPFMICIGPPARSPGP